MKKVHMVTEFPYHVYADFGNGMQLAAWYWDYKDAVKEANFLKKKGHNAKVVKNDGREEND